MVLFIRTFYFITKYLGVQSYACVCPPILASESIWAAQSRGRKNGYFKYEHLISTPNKIVNYPAKYIEIQ